MVLKETPPVARGLMAPPFSLKGVDGKMTTFNDVRGRNGTVVMFICHHCPYVLAIKERMVEAMKKLLSLGVGVVAVMSNDTVAYPEDNYEKMKEFSREHGFPFPYLFDETQEVARAYDAACTPDFFGFDHKNSLVYRGRLDSAGSSKDAYVQENAKPELVDFMGKVAQGNLPHEKQMPSIGCSIKWRTENV